MVRSNCSLRGYAMKEDRSSDVCCGDSMYKTYLGLTAEDASMGRSNTYSGQIQPVG